MPAADAPDRKATATLVPTPLTRALRALDADDRERLSASPAVEARLFAEVQARGRARRHTRWHMALASAAAVVIAAAGVWVSSRPANVQSANGNTETFTDFMPLMYGDVPATESHLVRLEVPRMALASFGVTPREAIDADAARRTVIVDVLVGEDGLARAVRFLQSTRAGSNR
jgi:hypothetical protein